MNKIIRVAVLMLFVLTVAMSQQQAENRGPDRFAVSVRELKGTCLVKDSEAANPRKLKSEDKLQAGQELQCEAKAYLRIRFRISGDDKEIKAVAPNWYVIPNVPGSISKDSGPKLAGRSKGNDPPLVTVTTGTLSTQQSSLIGGGRARPVQTPGNGALDDADMFWKSRPKYFLIVAATKTAGAINDLPFTKVDAQRISKTLTALGYLKLETLSDELATHDDFVGQLQKIRKLPPNAMVIVYYSGHAVMDPQGKDLWLQLYGQKQFGDHFGISVSDLVDSARGGVYKGGLAIILDTCYSGRAVWTSQLSLRETENTVIFASSAYQQPSYSKLLLSGREISAFTYYLLEGLEADWAQVDGDADGIILYSDLQIYIGNRLLEQLRDGGILGPMQPQLFGQSPKIWAAYDPQKARNLETQQIKNLRLERTFQVQDPEKVAEMLPTPLPPGTKAYFRALKALKEDQFDSAWLQLEEAEKEQTVSLAEIFWARAVLKYRQGELASGRDWFEKALAASPQPNVDLVELTANANLALGNWVRAEAQFKQVIDLLGGENEDKPEMIDSLVCLAMMSSFSGDPAGPELYLGRLKRFGVSVLERHEAGLSQALQILELLLDVLKGKNESASRKLAQLRQNPSTQSGDVLEALRPVLRLADAALNTRGADAPKVASLSADTFKQWDQAIQQRKANNVLLSLSQLQVIANGSIGRELLRTAEVQSRLRLTIDFARQHKSERQRVTFDGPESKEIELEGSEEQSVTESANLITGAAVVFAARGDVLEAEKLFKEAFSLEEENAKRPAILNSLMRLAELYEDSGRVADTEQVYRKTLSRIASQSGEQSYDALRIHEQLGRFFERQGRWDAAEQSYQTVVRLSQVGFGSDSFFAIAAQETLATFLFQRGRFAESIPLFEHLIGWFELRRQTEPGFIERSSLGDDYFQLAKCYYKLGRYVAAESAFDKASDLISAKEDADLVSKSACLVWQWFSADALKKPEKSKRVYNDLIQLIQLELSLPHPNWSLGENLQDFSSWFRDSENYSQAEDLLRLALAVQKKAYGDESLEAGYVWESLGDLDIARGHYRNAIVSLKIAQSIYEKQSPPLVSDVSYVLFRIGYANYAQLDLQEARIQLKRSVELLQQAPETVRSDNFPREQLARVERLLGYFEAAKKIMKAVLEEEERAQSPNPINVFAALIDLTSISRSQGQREEASQWLARAQRASERVDPKELQTYWSLFDFEKGMAALGQGKTKEAAELIRLAVEKRERSPLMDEPLLVEYLEAYAAVMRQRGKDKEAILLDQRAKQIREMLKNK